VNLDTIDRHNSQIKQGTVFKDYLESIMQEEAILKCLYDPSIGDKPVAVGGDAEARHGIISAKNQIA